MVRLGGSDLLKWAITALCSGNYFWSQSILSRMGVEHPTYVVPGLLTGASPTTYGIIGVGVVIGLIVLGFALVEMLTE